MKTDIAQLRQEYRRHDLSEIDVQPDPIDQFQQWFDEAVQSGVSEPNAMTVATVDADGQPSARILLLKGIEDGGFVFFTNYESRKGAQLAANPRAALVFWWEVLERQVRVEGVVERIDAASSDAYFESRPRGSRLGAWASPQSRPIESRDVLTARLSDAAATYEDRPVPRPPHWGGYRLRPHRVEFWQGRPSRLHDRLDYVLRDDGTWHLRRLAP